MLWQWAALASGGVATHSPSERSHGESGDRQDDLQDDHQDGHLGLSSTLEDQHLHPVAAEGWDVTLKLVSKDRPCWVHPC